MKTILLNSTILIALVCSFFTNSTAQVHFANNNNYTVEEKVLTAAADLVTAGYTVDAYDFYSLAEKEQIETSSICYAGLDYAVLVITEDGVYDVDLFIYDSMNNLITTDASLRNDIYTATEFQMYKTTKMKIVTKNFSSQSKYKAYEAVILIAYR